MTPDVFFDSDGASLHGQLTPGDGRGGVVITHPHPLYGGDMNNPVVLTIAEVYRQAGYAVLRFNFRGVGRSGGNYDGGAGERRDVQAALSLLLARGVKNLDLAGYSFGAWVNAHLPPDPHRLARMVMVAPPVALMDFDAVGFLPALKLVVTGARDELAPEGAVRQCQKRWNRSARLEIVPAADHFFGGQLKALAAALARGLILDD